MKPPAIAVMSDFGRQIQRSQIPGAYVSGNVLQRRRKIGRPIYELAEFGALQGVGTQRIAGVFPSAPQIAPQVPEIRKSWIVHGAPMSAELLRRFLPARLVFPSAPEKSVGSSRDSVGFLFYRSLD
jgi:hypothetical protein